MKRKVGAFLFIVAAVCLYMFGVIGTLPEGGEDQYFKPFGKLSTKTLLLFGGGLVALIGGMALVLARTPLPGTKGGLANKYASATLPMKNRVWEGGLLFNGLLTGGVIVVLFLGGVNKWWDGPYLGAILMLAAVQIAVSLVLVFMFIIKKEKSGIIFLPGVVLFLVETACVAMIFIFGMGEGS